MPVITLLVYLILVGVLLWIVNTYIPMAAPIKTLINVVVVIILIIWIANMFVPLSSGMYIGRH